MSSTTYSSPGRGDERPEFMAILGLLPPYALEDVKKAYLDKIRTAHPDHGGDIATFRRIQEAYEAAQRYLEFHTDKRAWIAAQMDRYIALSQLEERLRTLGADIEYQPNDWLEKSYGDFAELVATVQAIKLHNSPTGNEVAQLLVAEHSLVSGLKRLELVCCGLTNAAVLPLSCFQWLDHLDLRGNKVTGRVIEVAKAIPNLKELRLEDTSVGPWGRRRLARILRKRTTASDMFIRSYMKMRLI